jgi:hypothetical protein
MIGVIVQEWQESLDWHEGPDAERLMTSMGRSDVLQLIAILP